MTTASFGEKVKYEMMEPHYSSIGIEFNSESVRLAVVRADRGKPVVLHLDSEKLPEGAMEINPFKANIHALEPVAAALKNLWARNSYKASRVCLMLQDRSALVFNLAMEHAAKNHGECLDLIRFKLKKNVPFRLEEAQISYFNSAGSMDYSSLNLWVLVLNHALLHQYEQFVQSALDVEVGLVDLASLGMMNLAHPGIRSRGLADKDLIFVNLNPDYLSLAITQKSNLTSFRTRPLDAGVSAVEAAMEEIHPTVMYYHDKLAGEALTGAFVHSVENLEDLCAQIESRTQIPALPVSIEPYAGGRFDSSQPEYLRGYAPLAGMLLSRMVEFS
jgi:type IV pilus assembly protein PilM